MARYTLEASCGPSLVGQHPVSLPSPDCALVGLLDLACTLTLRSQQVGRRVIILAGVINANNQEICLLGAPRSSFNVKDTNIEPGYGNQELSCFMITGLDYPYR